MSDWDASEDEAAAPVPVAAVKKFVGEDEDVQDDWDASDDDKPGASQPQGPIRRKGITKQKIAEREAAEAAEAEQREREAREAADPAARRERDQAAVLASDMDNMAGLFGSANLNPASSVADASLFAEDPKTPAEFDALAVRVAERVHAAYGTRPHYASFVEALVKQLCTPLKDVNIRKASSALSALANEMQAAQRASAKGGKKKTTAKPTLSAPRGNLACVPSMVVSPSQHGRRVIWRLRRRRRRFHVIHLVQVFSTARRAFVRRSRRSPLPCRGPGTS